MSMYSVETLSQEAYIFTNILHKIIIKKFKIGMYLHIFADFFFHLITLCMYKTVYVYTI